MIHGEYMREPLSVKILLHPMYYNGVVYICNACEETVVGVRVCFSSRPYLELVFSPLMYILFILYV